jgi:hypothetical protein
MLKIRKAESNLEIEYFRAAEEKKIYFFYIVVPFTSQMFSFINRPYIFKNLNDSKMFFL